MKLKNSLFFLFIALAGSSQAISFRDYHYGSMALGIPSHEKEINDEVAKGSLNLRNKELTDLNGFNEVPDLDKLLLLNLSHNKLATLPENIFQELTRLRNLFLNDNRLTKLSANIFHSLTALQMLDLYNNQLNGLPINIFNGLSELRRLSLWNNPIPLTKAQLVKELQLPLKIEFSFKTQKQARAEQELFAAIKNADVLMVGQWLADIMNERVRAPWFFKIDITKIRNSNDDNLLHAAIKDAAERLRTIDRELGIVRRDEKLSPDEKKKANNVLLEQKSEINDRYMKIISEILSCGEKCVRNMLFTPNAEGQQVIDAMFAKLGFDSPITQAILFVLNPEGSSEAHPSLSCQSTEKEEKGQHEIQK